MKLEQCSLVEGVILRTETFGAILYNPKSYHLIFLNDSAAKIVVSIQNRSIGNDLVRIASHFEISVQQLIDDFQPVWEQLLTEGFILESQELNESSKNDHSHFPIGVKNQSSLRDSFSNDANIPAIAHRMLSSPISVHIGITNRCNLQCPSCYVVKDPSRDLPLDQGRALILQLIDARVLNIAFGGGEPLLYPNIWELLETCQRHMNCAITTNATLITQESAQKLAQLGPPFMQVSLNGQTESQNAQVRTTSSFNDAIRGIEHLKNAGIPFGINYIVTPQNLPEIPAEVKFFQQLGAHIVNFIRPKSFQGSNEWFTQHMLTARHLLELQWTCKVLVHKYSPAIRFTVDSSLALLMMDQSVQVVSEHLLPGCGAGSTFCYVDPNLSVFPCSHLVGKAFLAGNLRTKSFLEVWRGTNLFKVFQEFPAKLTGACGTCSKKWYCGGCRVLAMKGDHTKFYNEDPDCPWLCAFSTK